MAHTGSRPGDPSHRPSEERRVYWPASPSLALLGHSSQDVAIWQSSLRVVCFCFRARVISSDIRSFGPSPVADQRPSAPPATDRLPGSALDTDPRRGTTVWRWVLRRAVSIPRERRSNGRRSGSVPQPARTNPTCVAAHAVARNFDGLSTCLRRFHSSPLGGRRSLAFIAAAAVAETGRTSSSSSSSCRRFERHAADGERRRIE